MIYTLIVDISRFSAEELIEKIESGKKYDGVIDEEETEDGFCEVLPCPALRSEVISHILGAKSEKLRRERTAAYISLSAIADDLFKKTPEISWTEYGKPFYKDENIYFSLSHCENMVAVSISDKEFVGVDIEGEISSERAERLEKRFFRETEFSVKPLNVFYMFAELSAAGCLCFYEILEDRGDGLLFTDIDKAAIRPIGISESFSAKWTLSEAVMKCEGSGFSSLRELNKLLGEASADIRKVMTETEEYYLSTVKIK